MLKRIVAFRVSTVTKLGLYKFLILPVLLYGFSCVAITQSNMLIRFRKKTVRWITGNKAASYVNQLGLLNILPLEMFLLLNSLLYNMNNWTHKKNSYPQTYTRGRSNEIFKVSKRRTEKARTDFYYRTKLLVNRDTSE